jgi:transcriptional regulator with XRE-family HTH domain
MLSTIGNKIRMIRELRNLTQENMADILKVSQIGYAKIERNEVQVTIQKLEQISEALGITLTDLLKFDDKFIFNISNMFINTPYLRLRYCINNRTITLKGLS